ncbi:unnamed protein product [Candidula unifasciata]|uniref:Uncharacterized protein n=1 Tax=Candidula unifasciata TaxID=100452 RepID=A0A8S3Z933_9EUPU|nr:unnamed protein product [Candidula unifasciata]
MSSIPDDAFETMHHLTSLTLDGNKLSVVPKALSGITTLQSLDISNCFISDITWLPKSSLLTSLSLGGNKLSNATHVSNALLPYAKSLSEVDFHDNQLTSIPDLHFLAVGYSLNLAGNLLSNIKTTTFPTKLDEIDLTSNLFSFIPSFMSTLLFVSTLSMSSNHVTALRSTDFISNILYIQLDRNLITELADTSFPDNCSIISLVLDYNPLTAISPSAFKSLINLTYMSLQNSHLTRLPLALASLKKLNTFDISGSQYLVCTCMEKDLAHWVVSTMSEYSVNGNCGNTSIYDFFKFLSPGCPVP